MSAKMDREFVLLSGQALAYVKMINDGGSPVICPPSLMKRLRQFPEFAKLIDEGKIIPNLPMSVAQ